MQPQQPNQPQQQPPYQSDYSVDYLNEITGPQKAAGGPSKLIMIIAAVVGLLSIVLFLVMILSGGPTISDKATDVYLRLGTLKEITDSQQENLRDNELRAVNRGLNLQLTNAQSAMAEPLAEAGGNVDAVDKDLEAKEEAYKEPLLDEFEDASLNLQLDTTYAREMAFQLEALRAMMDSTYRQTNNESLQTYLDETARDLYPFSEKLSNFRPN